MGKATVVSYLCILLKSTRSKGKIGEKNMFATSHATLTWSVFKKKTFSSSATFEVNKYFIQLLDSDASQYCYILVKLYFKK